MRMKKTFEIEVATANKGGKRPTIEHVLIQGVHPGDELSNYIDVGEHNGIAIATDGFILAVVPVTLQAGDIPGLVSKDHFKYARKKENSLGGVHKDELAIYTRPPKENSAGYNVVRFGNGEEQLATHSVTTIFPALIPILEPLVARYNKARDVETGVPTMFMCLDHRYFYRLGRALCDNHAALDMYLQSPSRETGINTPVLVWPENNFQPFSYDRKRGILEAPALLRPPFGIVMPKNRYESRAISLYEKKVQVRNGA